MKRFQYLFLPFFSIVWSMNVMAFEVDGFSYDVLSENDKTALVARQSLNLEGDIQIPSQVCHEGTVYTVTKIGGSAFSDCRMITSVSVPATVQSIGARAFYECAELTSVRLSDNITEIGDDAFIRCRKLKDINIPKNLQSLGEFPEAVKQEAVFYVPQGTVEKYRSMRGWRDFLDIKESSQTVIETPTYTNDISLLYYTLNGRRSIGLPTKGIYIQNGRKRVE